MKGILNWHKRTDGSAIVASAQILSRNGGFGCVFIKKMGGKFWLEAASEMTGRMWKAPLDPFDTVADAKAEAERRWYPA